MEKHAYYVMPVHEIRSGNSNAGSVSAKKLQIPDGTEEHTSKHQQ
jgi:hypothetical protein